MAKRFELEMFGLPVIMRHDYEDANISHKINGYRKKSVQAFTEFLTNVPGSEKFERFLDVGAGDHHDMNYFGALNPNYDTVKGIDLYLDAADYSEHLVKMDWYEMAKETSSWDAIYMNHSLEHAANVYAVMQQISMMQKRGAALFISVPEGNSEFGYAITSSTTHFSVITKGFLSTTLQRFGYNVVVEDREFREGSPELFAFAIKQRDGL